jgi:hypothetical protein
MVARHTHPGIESAYVLEGASNFPFKVNQPAQLNQAMASKYRSLARRRMACADRSPPGDTLTRAFSGSGRTVELRIIEPGSPRPRLQARTTLSWNCPRVTTLSWGSAAAAFLAANASALPSRGLCGNRSTNVPPGVAKIPYAMFVGLNRALLHYPLRHRTIMNVIGMARERSWQEEGWAIPATIDEFTRLYGDFHRDALDLMNAISPGTLFKWGLRDREPLRQYARGRVTMLGDAAHPMTPFLGQGACVAIEDAMVLGRAFAAASTFEEAFGIYENTRKERANGVQLASREQANEIQGVTEMGPNPGATADDRGLYLYNPVTVPLAPAGEMSSTK